MSFISYQPDLVSSAEAATRAREFFEEMDGRRTIREFDNRPVPREVIEDVIRTASTAPSGAHKQPWTFVAIANPELKQKIRAATEAQEKEFYERRITEEWRADFAPLGTDFEKSHITDAPWLIVVFAQDYGLDGDKKSKHYYVNESVGIACGFLLAAIRKAGLCALTHTPSPMKYLQELLGRPSNERTFLVIPVGYPSPDCKVPDLARKPLDDVAVFLD